MDQHNERLQFLKNKGFNPKVIYDIGAHKGLWSYHMWPVFPDSQFYLFEANKENKCHLSKHRFPFFIGLLGDKDKAVTFFTSKIGDSSGASVFCEQTGYYRGAKLVKQKLQMKTLQSLVKKHKLQLPDLIKFDVQGAESLIIDGSPQVVTHAEVIVMETKILEYNKGAPLIHEMMSLMTKLGYRMLDIVEHHHLPSGELNEIDIVFVKKDSKLIKTGLLK